MSISKLKVLSVLALLAILIAAVLVEGRSARRVENGRSEVVFWHFWGGKDRPVVEAIVEGFNAGQDEFFVRAIAMPGNNLDLKFFLSVAGGDPPDVVNQDDPIVAGWAHRDAIVPLDELADLGEIAELQTWLYPVARQIGSYRERLYALCNGLDLRALYYNADILEQFGLRPPRTLEELDAAALTITPPDSPPPRERYGFLPDPRRLWSWGIVFGGRFYDFETGRVTADNEPIVAALDWMASYSRRYGADQVARFRKGDQALPGASFPLFQGRYAMIMDGQWRVGEIAAQQRAAQRSGQREPRYGVVPLPPPRGGVEHAGWVNGNFFVVPRGARNPRGAWAFMKFWSGFGGNEAFAARACTAGGWVPASPAVAQHAVFQDHMRHNPLLAVFVDLAASANQLPTPGVPRAQYFQDEIIRAAEDAMYKLVDPHEALATATRRVQARLEAEREKD